MCTLLRCYASKLWTDNSFSCIKRVTPAEEGNEDGMWALCQVFSHTLVQRKKQQFVSKRIHKTPNTWCSEAQTSMEQALPRSEGLTTYAGTTDPDEIHATYTGDPDWVLGSSCPGLAIWTVNNEQKALSHFLTLPAHLTNRNIFFLSK